MKDDTLIKTSIEGVAILPLCCLALAPAPLLGLSAWPDLAGYPLLPASAALLAIAAVGVFYFDRRSGADTACRDVRPSRPRGIQR